MPSLSAIMTCSISTLSPAPVSPMKTLEQRVGEYATSSLRSLQQNTKLLITDSPSSPVTPTTKKVVRPQQIDFISRLGGGSFCDVYQVRLNDGQDAENDNSQPEEAQQHYALKCLRSSTRAREESFMGAASDLVIEAHMLSNLSHPNIVKLYGVASHLDANCDDSDDAESGFYHDMSKSYVEHEMGYYLIQELLTMTLKTKLEQWQKEYPKQRTVASALHSSWGKNPKPTRKSTMLERVNDVAIGISSALEYIHSKQIIFRDLKPDNIGFDAQGNVKLFDFGFARELHTIQGSDEIAGSLRYMAPESVLGIPINTLQDDIDYQLVLSSDVYSFGILLWEICTLEKPYHQYRSVNEFKRNVVCDKKRPSLKLISTSKYNNTLRDLISTCWDPYPRERPSFTYIKSTLQQICNHKQEQQQVGGGSHVAVINNDTSNRNETASLSALISPRLFKRSMRNMLSFNSSSGTRGVSSTTIPTTSMGGNTASDKDFEDLVDDSTESIVSFSSV